MIFIILKLIFICFLLVLGATIVTQEGMLLYSIREWAEKQGNKIYEPLILCPWCMSSVWSIAAFCIAYALGIFSFSYKVFLMYPIVVCGGSIVSGMIWTLYRLMSEVTGFYSNQNKIVQNENEEINTGSD